MLRGSLVQMRELDRDGHLAERRERLHNKMSDSDYLQCFLLLQMSSNNKELCTLY